MLGQKYGVPSDAGYLVRYQWPGSVRELQIAIEPAVILVARQVISANSLTRSRH